MMTYRSQLRFAGSLNSAVFLRTSRLRAIASPRPIVTPRSMGHRRPRGAWRPARPGTAGLRAGPALHRIGLPAHELGFLQNRRIHAASRPAAAQDERQLLT